MFWSLRGNCVRGKCVACVLRVVFCCFLSSVFKLSFSSVFVRSRCLDSFQLVSTPADLSTLGCQKLSVVLRYRLP
jgi:hypothetical protein